MQVLLSIDSRTLLRVVTFGISTYVNRINGRLTIFQTDDSQNFGFHRTVNFVLKGRPIFYIVK